LGLRDIFRREKAITATPAVIDAIREGKVNTYQRLGGTNQQINAAWLQYQAASYAYMYSSQPAVRKVVDFIAWNISQIGLKLYERAGDTDRRRDTDHPAAQTMANPDGQRPADQFILYLVTDYLINENAYALIFRSSGRGPRTLIRVPPPAVEVVSSGGLLISGYRIWLANGDTFPARDSEPLPPEDIIHWCGYNPELPGIGVSRLETLRATIAEEAASQQASIELRKAGLSKPGYIKRPLEAAEWSEEARQRFQESWSNQAKASTRRTPVLEEGMEFADFGISPKDAEMLEGRRFTNAEVASLYGLRNVPPDGDEERNAFYADVLPPITQSLASQLDFSLLDREYAEPDHYFEFDLNEKLRGEPEKRFAAITSAVGRPWLTANEARSMENRPPLDGGDDLVTPLNVLVGGVPAPNVMPPQNPNGPPQDGSHREKALILPRQRAQQARRDRYGDEFTALLIRHYERQERALKSAKAISPRRWQQWINELAADLEALLRKSVQAEGDVSITRFGGEAFDLGQVRNYLHAEALGVADGTTSATREKLAELTAAEVYADAIDHRAPDAGQNLGTKASSFAAIEAAKQAPGATDRVKTWIVTAPNSAHPEMNGETVQLQQNFSNGRSGPPYEHPRCECLLSIA